MFFQPPQSLTNREHSIWDLSKFSLLDMLRCSRGLQRATSEAKTFGEASSAIVRYLYDESRKSDTDAHQCALIRFYKTSAFAKLGSAERDFVDAQMAGVSLDAETRVLTMMATVGAEEAWCDRMRSAGHLAIPLPSVEIVERAPMIAGLIRALGIDIADVVAPNPVFMDREAAKTYDVFHVEKAAGSVFIPAQDDFVMPYGIQSVIGFGGLLADGELFAVVMFTTVPVPPAAAGRFRNIALDVKAITYPLAERTFQ
ncbi:MAG: hypothetical protein ABIS03_05380 [Gemmatimonadaceae bacterium]